MDDRSINQRNGTSMIAIASTAITLALVFYTIGVFAERRAGTLKLGHIIFFYMGLVFDTAGTAIMSLIARGESTNPAHAATGLLAIILMIVHAAWATAVLVRKNHEAMAAPTYSTHKARSISKLNEWTYSSLNTTTTPSPPIDTFLPSLRP